jgi:medium-chain acyl-[acyl-carrier-protein] hydrolase
MWPDGLPSVEILAVQLPGREDRLREQPFARLSQLIDVLAEVLAPHMRSPFAFFGHSVGALIGFELARKLRRQNARGPVHLFVSARRAPQIPEPGPPLHRLPDAAFKDELRRFNGTPEVVLREPELMELFLPLLRADFALLETYVYSNDEPLDCPITAFGGLQDTKATSDELAAWREQTKRDFTLRMFPGGHFYLQNGRSLLLGSIARDLLLLC